MNWTPDRPTKPGKYHVYVAPKNRGRLSGYLIVTLDSHDLEDLDRNELYAGAQWLPYVEPPDPFAEGGRLIAVTLTVEERQTLSSALNIVARSVREMPWDRPEDGDRARELASKMEALNTRLCEVPQ